MTIPLVRPSTDSDVAAIARIYGHYVCCSTATFELEPPAESEIAKRRAAILSLGLPYLVVEGDGAVGGYAYANIYRPRPAYRFTIEDSIYIDPALVGRGLGQAALAELIEQCRRGPWRQMVAVIGDSANLPSIRLHQRFGFREVGTLRSVGFKLDRWVDTVLMQRELSPPDSSHNGSGARPEHG